MQPRRRQFADRAEAGRELAAALASYADATQGVVLALPRGGVPVAAPIATALGLPLDVVVVRKLGLPGQPELAMGAIAAVGKDLQLVRNESVLAQSDVSEETFARVLHREEIELRRHVVRLRGVRAAPHLRGLVVLVDDGLATGSTMLAAVAAVKANPDDMTTPPTIVVALPVGAEGTCQRLRSEVDDVVCLWTPHPFFAVGQAYQHFGATSENEARMLLDASD